MQKTHVQINPERLAKLQADVAKQIEALHEFLSPELRRSFDQLLSNALRSRDEQVQAAAIKFTEDFARSLARLAGQTGLSPNAVRMPRTPDTMAGFKEGLKGRES